KRCCRSGELLCRSRCRGNGREDQLVGFRPPQRVVFVAEKLLDGAVASDVPGQLPGDVEKVPEVEIVDAGLQRKIKLPTGARAEKKERQARRGRGKLLRVPPRGF